MKTPQYNFDSFLDAKKLSNKQKLIHLAQSKNVCIYVDDHNEVTSGAYGCFRAVASEVELQRRLTETKKFRWQQMSAIWAIACSICAGFAWAVQLYIN